MSLDLSKPLQTRDGREARIYASDGGGEFPVHGAVKNFEVWRGASWTIAGKYFDREDGRSVNDLVNVPAKMLKRRLYVSTWGEDGYFCAINERLTKSGFAYELTALNFPIDIEIPEGFGL